MVSLVTICQFLCMMAESCLPMYEKGVIMGRILVSICGVHWMFLYVVLIAAVGQGLFYDFNDDV